MTTMVVSRPLTGLGERIDRSLAELHALPGLDAHALARTIGVSVMTVRAVHLLRHGRSVRASLAEVRVDSAERLLSAAPSSLPASSVIGRTAESVGFHSSDEMDRAFLRLRHRSSLDVLLASRLAARGAAA